MQGVDGLCADCGRGVEGGVDKGGKECLTGNDLWETRGKAVDKGAGFPRGGPCAVDRSGTGGI